MAADAPGDLLVLGDSVPNGERTDATAWPHRLPDLVDGLADATVAQYGSMGTELAGLTADVDDALVTIDDPADDLLVVVHAGHNDAQLSGGEPRVDLETFATAASALDDALAADSTVDGYAFVGIVPLLRLDDPDSVPFADCQPDRSLRYDDALADAVGTHIPVARPVEAWHSRTVDGVHPNEAGHEAIAQRVAAWLENTA